MGNPSLRESLSPIERRVLPVLTPSFTDLSHIEEKSSQDLTTLRRALGLLESKGLASVEKNKEQSIGLDVLGIHYTKSRLPERVLLTCVASQRELPIASIQKKCGLNANEAKIALGTLKKKGFIEIQKGVVALAVPGEEVTKKMPEESFLEKLPLPLTSLKKEDTAVYEALKSRKEIITILYHTHIRAKLTQKGRDLLKQGLNEDLIEELTPKMIKQGSWKGKKFRRYDIKGPVPKMYGGKRHFVNQAKEYARSIWRDMGFKEMKGSMVQSSFWVFDALFTPQDHPVREMQDTFFIKDMQAKLPNKTKEDTRFVSLVRRAHEKGVGESSGWRSDWSEEEARSVVLRTHTTALSVQTLKEISKTEEIPAKYFSLGKCFRNETVDWSHGFEFYQTDGIVIDKNATFRQLIGYLKQFFAKMGYEKIRLRPAYFAYTEPSLEIDVFHPHHKKWVELGGAGMFRPEVTIPIFGSHIPVLAWGPGFDRIIMEHFKITDLRDMYKNNITQLRDMKQWTK